MLKNADNTTKFFLIGIVFLVMIFYILLTNISDNKEIDYSFIDNYFNSITDNYTLDIKTDEKNIIYSRDKQFELYESTSFEKNQYIKYNGTIYTIVDERLVETDSDDLSDRYYYDLKLISKINKYCNYKKLFNESITCNIKAEDYNKEFLSLYGLGRLDTKDVVITYNVIDEAIKDISINYGEKVYNIKISNVAKNNYDELLDLIK